MNKSKMSIYRIKEGCSSITYDKMRVSRVAPIEIRDNRYKFINGRKSLLLYFDFFDICDRSKYNTVKSSPKLVGDMVCNRVEGLVGYSTYYREDGDIFCESGCIYTKSGNILFITLLDLNTSGTVAVINKSQIDHDLVKYILNCYKKNICMISSIIIGNPFDYIKPVNKCLPIGK